ncbi:MAG: GNAT family N-acetyltransferase [Alphaproteobacteria bacterium]|nr:GNAT family N-acetyltransferase [Alphaproteobacteria bacterium]
MNLTHAKPAGRFSPPRLFAPESVAILDADTPAGRQVLANLLMSGFQGAILPVARGLASVGGVLSYQDIASLPLVPDLAILAGDDADLARTVPALAAKGTFAAVVLGKAGDPGALLAESGVRILGPESFGIAVTRIGLNATRGHLPPKPGRVALVSQSVALCRAVLDWAEPNGVGFSHIVGIGGNIDLGFGVVLDWLSRDPGTGAVLLDIRHIRRPRGFISAARAAARTRPIVAIRAGGQLIDPTGRADLAFEAALRRAGILSVTRFDELLAAAETLTRARPLRGEALAIVTNAVGLGQLAADAALRHGVELATLTHATHDALGPLVTPSIEAPDSGPAYAGLARPGALAEAAARLVEAPEVGGVLAVHGPSGPEDTAAISALAALGGSLKAPLLVAAMGETTGAAHRRTLTAAGLPTFDSPEQAVRGFINLLNDRRNHAAARELPPSTVLTVSPDRARVRALFAAVRAAARRELSLDESLSVIATYGLPRASLPPKPDTAVLINVWDDATFGPVIDLRAARPTSTARAADLPPLNLPLAHGMIVRAGLPVLGDFSEAALERIAEALVRLSELVVGFPEIAAVAFYPLVADPARAAVVDARICLHEPGAVTNRLAITPYPAELVEEWTSGGERLTIRPIRPEDAQQHGAWFHRLSPEDVRFRFFSAMRDLQPEYIARLTQVDYDREMAFVAVRATTGETVGVSRIVVESDERSAEFAIAVQPDIKGKGLGKQLMRKLLEWGRAHGIEEIIGHILADNAPMLAFVRRLGFELHRAHGEEDVIRATLRLTPDG